MSKTKLIVHIVFSTKYRQPTLLKDSRRELYAYIHGIIQHYDCFTLRINGIEDHVHILLDLHPTVAVATLVKEIKQSSSIWAKNHFPKFRGWNEGYYAVSLNPDDTETCRKYIMEQESHHHGKPLIEEMHEMAERYGMAWHSQDWAEE